MSRSRSPYLALEQRIAADERGGIFHRWQYGRRLVEAKAGRNQLPHGLLDDLVQAAARASLEISRRELQRRLRLAEVYSSEAELRQILAQFGTWSALADAGFPPVESTDPDDLEADGISTHAPDAWDQPALIPGFGETIKVRGRKVPLAEATVADAKAYRETFRQIHENFGKTLDQIDASVEAMIDGSDGDDDANAVEAWQRGTDVDDESGEASAA